MLRALLAAACIAAIVVIVFVDLPGKLKYVEVVQNWGHAPVFGLLSLGILYLKTHTGKRAPAGHPRDYFFAAAVAIALGVAVEIVQFFIGRDADPFDALQDALGIGATLSIHAWLFRHHLNLGARQRKAVIAIALVTALWAMAPVAACAAAYWHRDRLFPVIADFRSPLDLYFIRAGEPPFARVGLPAGVPGVRDQPTLRVPFGDHPWPGVVIEEPKPDWSGYQNLAVDISNPNASELTLLLTIHDRAYIGGKEDRYNRTFVVPAHERFILKTPLRDIEHGPEARTLNMRELWRVAIVQDRHSPQPAFFLNRVWLE